MPRVRRALRKSFTSLLFSSFSLSFLPPYIFFLCSFYNAKASWSFICNSWFFLHDILYFTLKYATWSEVNGKAYVLTEWHMEIWCLDTFSQQQSKVFTKEFLHYLIDSLTLGTSGKTERKREGEGWGGWGGSRTGQEGAWPVPRCGADGAQMCPALCDPVDCSPPGFSVHGISQGRILEWVAISFSRESSQPRSPALQVGPPPLMPPGSPQSTLIWTIPVCLHFSFPWRFLKSLKNKEQLFH